MPSLGIIAFFLLMIWWIIASIRHKKTDYLRRPSAPCGLFIAIRAPKESTCYGNSFSECLDMESAFVIVIFPSQMAA